MPVKGEYVSVAVNKRGGGTATRGFSSCNGSGRNKSVACRLYPLRAKYV